jgi:hypothetical protein
MRSIDPEKPGTIRPVEPNIPTTKIIKYRYQ